MTDLYRTYIDSAVHHQTINERTNAV